MSAETLADTSQGEGSAVRDFALRASPRVECAIVKRGKREGPTIDTGELTSLPRRVARHDFQRKSPDQAYQTFQ